MDTLKIYRGYSANLFPLRRCIINDAASKRPLITDWRNADYPDAELIKKVQQGHGVGWALSTTDLVIDVDAPTPQRPGKKGLVSLASLENLLGVKFGELTNSVLSPSGGIHYYLTKPSDFKTTKALPNFPDIDFLTAGAYVVIAGSPHWQGDYYNFSPLGQTFGVNRAEAPEGLLKLIARPEITHNAVRELTADQLGQLLSFLDPTDYRENDSWFQVMAACHSATAGQNDGAKVFVDWSTSDPQYRNAKREILARWKSLRPGGGITLSTLYGELKRNGRDGYQRLIRDFDISKMFDVVTEADIVTPSTLPKVEYGLNEMAMNAEIIEALVERPNLYQRLGSLSDVIFIDETPTIRQLKPVHVRELISSSVQLGEYKYDKKTRENYWQPKRVTDTIANAIASRGFWEGIPFLRGLVESPAYLSNGTILQKPGYDAESKLFYTPTIEFPPTKEKPSRADALESLDLLADVVCDFPFKAESHRNVFIAAVLTMVARHAINGPVPLTFIDGNGKGVGKTLLADVISLIGAGRSMPKSNYPNNDAEMAKQITAIALAAYSTQLIDNVPNGADFGFASLDAALTSDVWQGRILGRSEIVRMPLTTQFFGTGNGLTVSGDADTIRRIAYCQLDYLGESPDSRKTFKHGRESDFRQMLVERRGELVNAALTILRAFYVSGDSVAIKAWGSFSAWSEVVRAPLLWLETADPLLARNDMDLVADQGKDQLKVVLEAIESISEGYENGLSATNIREEFYKADFSTTGASEAIIAARDILCPKVNTSPQSIGRLLTKQFKDRVSGGRRLEFFRPGGARRWKIVRVSA